MGMTIEEAIKRLGDVRRNYDKWSGLGLTTNESEAFRLVIDTMRKYQKIEDIYYHQRGEALENSLRAVIEDGKID